MASLFEYLKLKGLMMNKTDISLNDYEKTKLIYELREELMRVNHENSILKRDRSKLEIDNVSLQLKVENLQFAVKFGVAV